MDLYLELDPRSTLPADSMLARTYANMTVTVDNRGNTEQCQRCGQPADAHEWRVYNLTDPSLTGQGGVLDCGMLGEER